MATITKVSGERNLYHIHVLDPHEGHPDQGLPGGGVDPGYGQGIHRPHRPDQGLPGGGHISNRPPGSGGGSGIPDNELPDHHPPQLAPGYTLVMVRGPHGKWEYAAVAPGSPPPRPLPPVGGGGHPDQGLPGQGGHPDQGLPGGQPHPGNRPPGSGEHPSGQPVPPQPTPQHR
jgi:hypothetical protein